MVTLRRMKVRHLNAYGRPHKSVRPTRRQSLTSRAVPVRGRAARHGGPERTLFVSPSADVFVEDWSADWRYLAIGMFKDGREQGALVPLNDKREPIVFANEGVADEFVFSPDARWLAYNAREQHRNEVFVVPVRPTGERWAGVTPWRCAAPMEPRRPRVILPRARRHHDGCDVQNCTDFPH